MRDGLRYKTKEERTMKSRNKETTRDVCAKVTRATGWWRRFGIFCLIVAATAIVLPAQDEQSSADAVKFTTFYGTTSGYFTYGYGTVFSLAVGLGPFVETVPTSGKFGTAVKILGTDLADVTSVRFNGTAAVFKVASKTLISATVPAGATTGFVTVTASGKTLESNVKFRVP
jgi:hypothetical protein